MPCTEVLCKCEACGMCLEWGWGLTLERRVHRLAARTGHCRRIHRSAPAGCLSSRLLPHSFLTLITWVGGLRPESKAACSPQGPPIWEPGTVTAWPGASWATVEELSFGPKAHGALRAGTSAGGLTGLSETEGSCLELTSVVQRL